MKIQSSFTPVYRNYNNYNNNQTRPNQVQGMVKCPHGNPGGTCPICQGMGGGGASSVKPKPTAKELGLLTWADLLPVWYAMQAAKQRKEYEARMENLNAAQKALANSQVYQVVNNFVNTHIKPVIKLLDSKVLQPTVKTIKQLTDTIKSFYLDLKDQIVNQLSKLAIVNQKAQMLLNKLVQSMEVFKTAIEKLISDIKEKEKAVKEFIADLANKFKKKLYKIIEAVKEMEDAEQRNKE